jgi:hypothetical protein
MIFYHFTFLKVVEGGRLFMRHAGEEGDMINFEPAPEGLTPSPGQAWGSCNLQHAFPNAPEVVWLTTSPATVPYENGFIWKCTVKIPSTDRKLINWPKWRDRNFPPEALACFPLGAIEISRHWWGYAGTIPLDRIVNIELLQHQKTPWYTDD